MQIIYTYYKTKSSAASLSLSVCLSVCLSAINSKTTERIFMSFHQYIEWFFRKILVYSLLSFCVNWLEYNEKCWKGWKQNQAVWKLSSKTVRNPFWNITKQYMVGIPLLYIYKKVRDGIYLSFKDSFLEPLISFKKLVTYNAVIGKLFRQIQYYTFST